MTHLSRLKAKSRDTGPSQAVRDLVYARDRFSCARCGTNDGPFSVHHRLPRGRGGDNRLSNLALLCDFGGCHDTAVESYREDAYRSGWLIRTGHDPATTPLIWHGQWSLLTDLGAVETVEVAS